MDNKDGKLAEELAKKLREEAGDVKRAVRNIAVFCRQYRKREGKCDECPIIEVSTCPFLYGDYSVQEAVKTYYDKLIEQVENPSVGVALIKERKITFVRYTGDNAMEVIGFAGDVVTLNANGLYLEDDDRYLRIPNGSYVVKDSFDYIRILGPETFNELYEIVEVAK